MKKELKNKKGFTIIETLFGVSIFVLILLVLTLFARNVVVYNSFISSGLDNLDTARQTLSVMVSEIRTASSAETGAYAINQATSNGFTFYSDIYGNGLKEKVRYFLNGSTLQKGVTIPSGSPMSYNPADEVITTLTNNVTNNSIFNYYDENYDGTTAPLSSPVDVSAVRLVKITITINTVSKNSPAPATFSTQVSIRNLKGNL